MNNATYISKDQNWQDGATTYWFSLDGEEFGIVESADESKAVDSDSMPIDYNDALQRRVQNLCVVTDEMRAA